MFTDTIFLSAASKISTSANLDDDTVAAVTIEALSHYIVKCVDDMRADPDYTTPRDRLRNALVCFARAYNAATDAKPEKTYNLPSSSDGCDLPKGKVFCNGRLVDGGDEDDQHFNW